MTTSYGSAEPCSEPDTAASPKRTRRGSGRTTALLVGGLAIVTLSVALVAFPFDTYPSDGLTGEENALGVLWETPVDDAFDRDSLGEGDQAFFTLWAVTWSLEGAVTRADRAGVSAYSLEDGEPLWRFVPEGEGLCTAAEHPAGSEQDIGVVLVEKTGGQGRDGGLGNACDTAVAIDLATGEELWRAPVGEPWQGWPEEPEYPMVTGVGMWADGPRVVVQRAQTLVGLDADGRGRELWSEEELLFPTSVEVPGRRSDEPCFQSKQELLLGGEGEAVIHGECDGMGAVGVLDTATGQISDRRALTTDGARSLGSRSPRLVSADPTVLACYRPQCGEPEGEFRVQVLDGDGEKFIDVHREPATLTEEDRDDPPYTYVGVWVEENRVVDDGVLYVSTDRGTPELDSEWSRIAAIDLTSGETLWTRHVEDHRMHGAFAVEDGRVLAMASTYSEETGQPYARLLAFPVEGEGDVEVIADGLPEMGWSNLRVLPADGRYVLTLSPGGVQDRSGTRNDVAPLYVVG